jgi:hypothetical protein
MKKFFSIIISLLILSFFTISAKGISVSPANKIIQFDSNNTDATITEVITVYNEFENDIQVTLNPTLITIDQNNRVKKIPDIEENQDLVENIEINENLIEIASNQQREIRVSFNNLNNFKQANIYPAISIQSNQNQNNNISISNEIISTFYLEDINVSPTLNIEVALTQESIFTDKVNISGRIENTGEKIFKPSGSINLSKDESTIRNIEITSLIHQNLLPGDSIEFTKEINLTDNSDKNIFEILGEYDINTSIKAVPYDDSETSSDSILFIPTQFIYYIIGIISTILLSLIILIMYSKKRRK